MNICEAEESYNYGFAITYDGDNHLIKFGQTCVKCGKYFESPKKELYCLDCLIKFIVELKTNCY